MAAVDTDDALGRLMTRYAGLRLSAASMDDLFTFIGQARDQLRKVKNGEDPAATAFAGFKVGFAVRDTLQGVPNGRRAEVARHLEDWLVDVLALSAADYRMVESWAARAHQARESAADSFKGKVRA